MSQTEKTMLLDGGRKFNAFVLVSLILAGIVIVAFFGLRESPGNLTTVLLAIIAIFSTSYVCLVATKYLKRARAHVADAAEHKHKGNDKSEPTRIEKD